VRELFEASGRTYGSPRIHADRAEGWRVGVNTVADSMRRPRLALLQVPTRNPTSG
jgi:putative transposase